MQNDNECGLPVLFCIFQHRHASLSLCPSTCTALLHGASFGFRVKGLVFKHLHGSPSWRVRRRLPPAPQTAENPGKTCAPLYASTDSSNVCSFPLCMDYTEALACVLVCVRLCLRAHVFVLATRVCVRASKAGSGHSSRRDDTLTRQIGHSSCPNCKYLQDIRTPMDYVTDHGM